ncbi:MAG TPA: membrane protein insertase YidC [Acidimicrobiales bacterium]|nr:membrane protein insertase YidC [Acidimicrobiales bacterium]
MYSFLNPIAKPIAAVLAAFYSLIPNFGVDILVLALIWMVIISPLTLKSTRSMLAMQALQPEIKRLQEKHRNDRQAFAQAQMDLFRERGVSPWGSCLPTILPLPVFFALFQVIDGLSRMVKNSAGHLVSSPRYLDTHSAIYHAITTAKGHINAFGLDLSKNPLSPHSSFAGALPYYLLLLIMIGTQYYQTSMMMNRNPAAAQNPQMKMMKYLPIVFGVILIRFPAGVILYYAMSNVCRIAQQWAMYRYDPKVKSLVVQEVNEIEAKTREIDKADKANKDPSGRSLPSKAAPAKPPAAGRPRLRDLLSPPAAPDQARPSNATAGRDRGSRPKGAPPAGSNRSGGQGTMAPGAKSAKGNPGATRKAPGDSSNRTAGNGNGSNRVKPNGKGSDISKKSSGGAPAGARGNPGAGSGSGSARGAAKAGPGKPGAPGTGTGSSGTGSSGTGSSGTVSPSPAAPGAASPATTPPNTTSNGSGSNGSGGGQRASTGAPRTGAGAKRNIPPPRRGRSKKRRGR